MMFIKVWGSNHSYNLSQAHEQVSHRTANIEDGARVDIKVRASGRTIDNVHIFDVRVFNPLTHTYRCLPLAVTEDMNRKREELMTKGLEKLNMDVFHPLFSRHLGKWVQQPK